jgi:hypothetical protein
MVKRLNLNPAAATDFSYAIPWIVVDFLMGLLVVWTYASIRPRYGPGPATAIRAGLIPFLAVSFVLYGFASLGIFDMAFYVKGTVFALVNTVIGSVIGAWAYKE